MAHGGRPRRENEQPDSAFGKALKKHLQRVEDFTQTDLARETGIPERTLSQMVKGKRTSGTMLRRDLRDIIEKLFQKKALLTLEEANQLITTIPAVSPLDARDPEDLKIIQLFDPPMIGIEQVAAQNENEDTSSESQDDASLSHAMPEPAMTPPQILLSPASE